MESVIHASEEILTETGECPVRRYHIEDSAYEIKRFEKAKTEVKEELEALFERAAEDGSTVCEEIMSGRLALLDDERINGSVYDIITDQMINAETAVAQTCDILMLGAGAMPPEDSDYMYENIHDVCERIIHVLLGVRVIKKTGGNDGKN